MIEVIRRVFSLDLRALALYRGGIGVLVVLDTLMRWRDLVPHYTDYGILPAPVFLEKFHNKFHWSLHLAAGTEMWQTFLFALTLIAGLSLIIGYKTRVASIACWVLIVSVQNRNPMILNGGDVLFRQLLFWGMLLPWHARWSVDRAMALAFGEEPDKEQRWLSFVSVAVIAQVCFVYWTTVALKTGKEWWPEGTASYYALALDQFTTRFGVWMSGQHTLLWLGTYFVYFLELLAPFMLLSPVFQVWMRGVAIVLLVGLHLNFDLTMRLGLFPWIDIVSLFPLIPGAYFDWAAKKLASQAQGMTIYYDDACNFCKKMALVINELRLGGFGAVKPASTDPSIETQMKEAHSWVVVASNGTRHLRWSAWVAILEASPFCGWAARRLPLSRLSPVGDVLYNLVARCREFFGRYTAQCLLARPLAPVQTGIIANIAALLLISYVGLWNIKTVPRAGIDIASPWIHLASILRLDQKWNMFAPFPLKDDGWYIIEGQRRDGAPIDVFRGVEGEVRWEKPELVSATYENARWRKYMMNIWSKRRKAHRLYYARYVCRTWNANRSYNSQLVNFKIHYMKETTPPPGGMTEAKKVTIWTHDCYKKTDQSQNDKAQDKSDDKAAESSL